MMLTSFALIAALFNPTPTPIGQCSPVDGPRVKWTAKDKQEVRRRVRDACRRVLRASPLLCAYYDAVVVRESFGGNAGVRHTLGKGENGLGPMGLSLDWHKDKWPGTDEDPAFCTPEVSLITAHAVVWRAFDRYNARDLVDVQAIYSGRWSAGTDADGEKIYYAEPSARTYKIICGRMEKRGFSCTQKMTKKDLGKKVRYRDRRGWVETVLAGLTATAS